MVKVDIITLTPTQGKKGLSHSPTTLAMENIRLQEPKNPYGNQFRYFQILLYERGFKEEPINSWINFQLSPFTCSGFSLCHFCTMEYIGDLLPYPSPPPNYPTTHILSAPHVLLCSNTMFLHASHSHLQLVLSSFICWSKT